MNTKYLTPNGSKQQPQNNNNIIPNCLKTDSSLIRQPQPSRKYIQNNSYLYFSVPSLEPLESSYLPVYTTGRKLYTKIYADDTRPVLSVGKDLRPDKIEFWNKKVPNMYKTQIKATSEYLNVSNFTKVPYVTINGGTNLWILISVCICLAVLTLVLSIGYYRLRQRVVKLLRQISLSSTVRML